MKKNMKGITLVSLVITIIVMLILAGVSISMATGNNGVLTRASSASVQTKISKIAEDFTLAVSDVEMQYQDAWANNSSIAAYKGVFFTVEKMNKALKEGFILCSGTASGEGIVKDNFKYNQQNYLTSYSDALTNSSELKKLVYTTEHPISQIAAGSASEPAATTTSLTTLKDPGDKYFTLMISDGKDEKSVGANTYVVVCRMKDGIPDLVDIGLVQNAVDKQMKNYQLSQSDSTPFTTADANAENVQITNVTDVTWYKNAKGLQNLAAKKVVE